MEPFLLSILIGSALLCFVFGGLEGAFFALNHLRIRQQMRAGNRRAALLHSFLSAPERYLRTVLAGNAITVAAVGLSGLALLHRWLDGPAWLLLAAGIGAIWFGVLCRLLPKLLFRAYPNRLSILFAPVFGLLEYALRPVAWIVAALADLTSASDASHIRGHVYSSREELRLTMQETHGLTSEERAMIHRVLDLQNLTVQQISIPIAKVTSVTSQTSISSVLDLAKERELSRFPVWAEQDGRRRIVGVVDLNSIIFDESPNEQKTATDYTTRCLRFVAGTRLEVALRELQRANQRLAAVVDSRDVEIGIVSLQDILKVIFGEVAL